MQSKSRRCLALPNLAGSLPFQTGGFLDLNESPDRHEMMPLERTCVEEEAETTAALTS
jgi:hypothetical protein